MSKKVAFSAAAAGVILAAATYYAGWWLYENKKIEQPNVSLEETSFIVDEPYLTEHVITPTGEIELEQPPKEVPKYVSNARKVELKDGYAKVVVVIDDVGVTEAGAKLVMSLPKDIVLSFIPYGQYTLDYALMAKVFGFEIMIHMPMEPMPDKNGKVRADPGPDALYVSDGMDIIKTKVQRNLRFLNGISVGVNNHMGSRFTQFEDGMKTVLQMINVEKLFFLDSLTTGHTAVKAAAKGIDMPILARDVFLDHSQNEEFVLQSLSKLEEVAKKNGQAIAIGHPHKVTVDALKAWAPTLEAKKIQLVPITAIIKNN